MKSNNVVKSVCRGALAVAVVGGGLLLSSQSALAEEVTETQGVVSTDNTTQSVANQETIVEATAPLTEAIETASAVGGLTVVEETVKDYGTVYSTEEAGLVQTIEQDYSVQAEEITAQVEAHVAESEAVAKENAQLKASYEADVKAQEEKIKAAESEKVFASDNFMVYGSVDESQANSVKYYSGLKVLGLTDKYDDSNFVDGDIKFTDNTDLVIGSNVTVNTPLPAIQEAKQTETIWQLTDLVEGSEFTLTNVGTTKSGTNINLKYKITEIPVGAKDDIELLIWRDLDNSIAIAYINSLAIGYDRTYVDDKGNPLTLLTVFPEGDLDWGQMSKMTFDVETIGTYLDDKARIIINEEGLYESLGNHGKAIDGFSATPEATLLHVGVANTVSFYHADGTIKDKPDGKVNSSGRFDENGKLINNVIGIQLNEFGESSSVLDVVKYPNEPEYKTVTDKTITYQLGSYKVQQLYITDWVDTQNNALKNPVTDTTTKPAGTFDKYRFVKTDADAKGNVKHVFERVYITDWVDTKDNPLKSSVTDTDTKPAGDIDNYRFVETQTDAKGNVKHVFERVYVTNWVDTNGNSLKDSVTDTGTKPAGDVEDYRFVETQTDAKGNVKHVFERVYVTDWVDTNGNSLKDSVTDTGTKPAGYIEDYRFVETQTDSKGNVKHVFERIYVTDWVDTDGKSLKDSVTDAGTKPAGDIDNYRFVETQTDDKGNVKHVFERVYITNWVDTDGNVLQDSVTDVDTKQAGTFESYEFVETKIDDKGNVTHIFKKVVTVTATKVEQTTPRRTAQVVKETTPVSKEVKYVTEETKSLPNTGDGSTVAMAVTGVVSTVLGMLGLAKRKED